MEEDDNRQFCARAESASKAVRPWPFLGHSARLIQPLGLLHPFASLTSQELPELNAKARNLENKASLIILCHLTYLQTHFI